MIDKRTWKEFRDAGLLWWINTTLHMFGWALVYNMDNEGEVESVYPARVKFRGFDTKSVEQGYIKVTQYLADNIEELNKETKE
jgi:hypothetical protein